LVDLIDVRIAAFPPATRRSLLAVALVAEATDATLGATVGRAGVAALRPAMRAGILESAGERCAFAHPLFASAVVAMASPQERADMHRRLAAVVEDEQRARHLALASDAPDEEVAAALEVAAQRVASRGAPATAGELLDLAIHKTPASDPMRSARRRVELVELAMRAGETAEARRHVDLVLDAVSEGPLRARALEQLARINFTGGTAGAGVLACDEALRQPSLDVHLRARLHATRAIVTIGHDAALAEGDARIALELLEQVDAPDPVVHVEAIQALIVALNSQGRPLPADLVERGLRIEQRAPNPVVADRLSAGIGAIYKYLGDFAAARHYLELTHRAAIEEGDDGSLPYAVSHLPQLELWSGDWAAAERWAMTHLELAEQTGQVRQRRQAIYNLAQVHAHLGRIDEATREAEAALADALADGADWEVWTLSAVLGFIALSVGDDAAAVTHLARSMAIGDKIGDAEPRRQMGDYAEALVAVGRLAGAGDAAERYVARATAAGNAMLLPNALRARAIVAGAEQRLDDAITAIEAALEAHRVVEVPFDRGRTWLAAGHLRRRVGERRAAREALESARDTFAKLGAPLWQRRADDALRSLPIRRRGDDALTAAESRVAALAAEGRSNREIAGALFVSVKTVEATLSRVYAKLGVRSRAGLAALLASRPSEGTEPKL
jgi:DNA-binding CsgD family transcriptional regulator